MLIESKVSGVAPGSLEGARSATGGEPGAAAEVKRWSSGRKKGVVLRLLRGEPVDTVSREVSVPIYKLEQWRDRALSGIAPDGVETVRQFLRAMIDHDDPDKVLATILGSGSAIAKDKT